ncbi:MAG: hypothetical protein ACRD1C_07995 [Terriglobales bacterium]
MTLRLWLILFIFSMAFSAEVLAWAVQHGQFTDVKRGNLMPLRAAGRTVTPPRPQWGATLLLWLGLAALTAAWLEAMVRLVQLAFS